MYAADYAPPGFFTTHLHVPGLQLRHWVIGLDMDLHTDELMAAYKYEARPHVRNEVVKDGLNIRVQVQAASTRCATCARTAHTLCSSRRSTGLLAYPAHASCAASAAAGSYMRVTAARLSAAALVQPKPCMTLTNASHAGDWVLSGRGGTLSGEHACHWFCSWRCQACSHRQGMGSRQMLHVEACIKVLRMQVAVWCA